MQPAFAPQPVPSDSGLLENTMVATSGKPVVLVVDDDRFSSALLGEQLMQKDYQVIHAASIEHAEVSLGNPSLLPYIDVMILDREMNGSDGLVLAHRMKKKKAWKHIPIVMLTGHDGTDEIRDGLQAGVFYYLCKPTPTVILQSVLELALLEVRRHRTLQAEMGKHRASFSHMASGKFEFSTLEHVEQLACFLANCFSDPERVLTGIAELMINAVEHGMLGITYAEKGELLKTGTWHEEVERRQNLPQNRDKKAEAIFTRREEGSYISIRDPGNGFAWKDFLTFDPARSNETHGRGIAQAAVSFDKLAYNEQGNEAVGFMGLGAPLAW